MTLNLYTRSYCSLCEQMQVELMPYQARFGFELRTYDVDACEELERAYGDRVPVLAGPEGELCHYFLDAKVIEDYFSAP